VPAVPLRLDESLGRRAARRALGSEGVARGDERGVGRDHLPEVRAELVLGREGSGVVASAEDGAGLVPPGEWSAAAQIDRPLLQACRQLLVDEAGITGRLVAQDSEVAPAGLLSDGRRPLHHHEVDAAAVVLEEVRDVEALLGAVRHEAIEDADPRRLGPPALPRASLDDVADVVDYVAHLAHRLAAYPVGEGVALEVLGEGFGDVRRQVQELVTQRHAGSLGSPAHALAKPDARPGLEEAE
jgi:hypothetical protein